MSQRLVACCKILAKLFRNACTQVSASRGQTQDCNPRFLRPCAVHLTLSVLSRRKLRSSLVWRQGWFDAYCFTHARLGLHRWQSCTRDASKFHLLYICTDIAGVVFSCFSSGVSQSITVRLLNTDLFFGGMVLTSRQDGSLDTPLNVGTNVSSNSFSKTYDIPSVAWEKDSPSSSSIFQSCCGV